MSEKRTRTETGYRKSVSKNGEFSPHIRASIAKPMIEWCEKRNLKKTEFVEQAIIEKLKRDKPQAILSMSQEEKDEIVAKYFGIFD